MLNEPVLALTFCTCYYNPIYSNWGLAYTSNIIRTKLIPIDFVCKVTLIEIWFKRRIKFNQLE